MAGKIDVGVLGATGMVGQQFISRLANHPWFNVSWLAASERSEGKPYAEAAPWRLATPMPESLRHATVEACVPGRGPKVVFSALDAKAADVLEAEFAAAGHVVLSNAKTFRMDPLVRAADPRDQRRASEPARRAAPAQRLVRRHRHQSQLRDRSCSRWRWRRWCSSASAVCW
jgi:aspartate-semialdehyde dehydrogenase